MDMSAYFNSMYEKSMENFGSVGVGARLIVLGCDYTMAVTCTSYVEKDEHRQKVAMFFYIVYDNSGQMDFDNIRKKSVKIQSCALLN